MPAIIGKVVKAVEVALKEAAKHSDVAKGILERWQFSKKVLYACVATLVVLLVLSFIGSVFYAVKKACGLPFVRASDMCSAVKEIEGMLMGDTEVLPFPNEKISELGEEIQKKRNAKIDAIGGGAQKYLTKKSYLDKETEVNEADMHLRILMDLDSMVIDAAKEEDIKSGVYANTNLERIWKISEEMKKSDKFKKAQKNAKEGKWSYREWMMYAQTKVYQCYFLGDDFAWDWIWGVEKPCSDLDELNAKVTGETLVDGTAVSPVSNGKLGTGYPSDADWSKYITATGSAVEGVKGLNADFRNRLAGMAKAKGEKIEVYSAYRSVARQQELYDDAVRKYGSEQLARKWVAYPGTSRHNFGLAVDVSGFAYDMSNAELAPYGLHKPMSYEPWHIEPVETKGWSTEDMKNFTTGTTASVAVPKTDLANLMGIQTVSAVSKAIDTTKIDYSQKIPGVEYQTFEATAYAPSLGGTNADSTPSTTSVGNIISEGRTVAVDPKVIPYGSVISVYSATYPKVNGLYLAEDTGGAIDDKRLDIMLPASIVWDFGRRNVEVGIVQRGTGPKDARKKALIWDTIDNGGPISLDGGGFGSIGDNTGRYVTMDSSSGGGTIYGDRSVVDQTMKTITKVNVCEKIKEETKKTAFKDLMNPVVFGSFINRLFFSEVQAKGQDTIIPATPCGPGTEQVGQTEVVTEEMTHVQLKEILDGFKKYSLYEDGTKAIPENENYEKGLQNAILFLYNESYAMDASTILGGNIYNGWMVPMLEGTYYMSSNYGNRTLNGSSDFHDGVDLAGGNGRNLGAPILAMQAGVVIFANPDENSPVGKVTSSEMNRFVGGYGGLVIIKHNNGWLTSYGHMKRSDVLVHPGWQVNQGQVISAVGQEGGVPPHLHFQMCESANNILCGMTSYNIFARDPEAPPINLVFNKEVSKVDMTIMAKQIAFFKSLKDKIKNSNGSASLEETVRGLASAFSAKEPFGALSAKYEAGKFQDAGYCSGGTDLSNQHCGVWKMNKDALTGFRKALSDSYKEPELANILKTAEPGTSAFAGVWKQAAALDTTKFYQLQKRYIMEQHYDKINAKLKGSYGFTMEQRSYAFQEMLISSSIQTDSQRTIGAMTSAWVDITANKVKDKKDEELIKLFYKAKRDRANNDFAREFSQTEIDGLKANRFVQEECDALHLAEDEAYKNLLFNVEKTAACSY